MSEDAETRHLTQEELDVVLNREGRLPDGRREHLHACDACRREAAELRQLTGALSRLARFEPSAGFTDRVMDRVRLPAARPAAAWLARWSEWAGAAAAVIALAAGGVWTFLLTSSVVPVGPLLRLALRWVEAQAWDLVVGAGQLLFNTGIAPALADAVRALGPGTALGGMAALSAVALAASYTLVKLMQLPAPAWQSARRA